MTMSEENKYNSFFPPQDSPIPVPPSEKAWSKMQQKLNVQMPVTHGRVFRLRIYRWGIPAATVAVVTVGVWVGLHKGGQRHTGHTGRPSAQVVSRGTAAKPMDSVSEGNAAGEGDNRAERSLPPKFTDEVRASADSAAGSAPVAGSVAPGKVTDRGREMRSGKSAGRPAKGEGTDGDRTAMVKTDGSVKKTSEAVMKTDGTVARTASTKNPGRMDMARMSKDGLAGTGNRKGGHRAGNGEGSSQMDLAGDQMGLTGSQRDLAGRQRDLAGDQRQSAGMASGASREALEEWRRHQCEGKAALLLPARIGSGHAGSFPDNLAFELASGRGVAKGPLAGKGQNAGKGRGANPNASAKSRKEVANKGGLILAAGLGDGQNFPLGGQQTVAINSSGGSGMLTDHLPSVYARLYIGDMVYLQAGLRLYSPQYTRPQQIDSTGDSSRLVGYQGYIQDTIVTLNKLYYTDIPLTVYYRVTGHFYLGVGLQYSRLWGGNTTRRVVLHPTNGADTNLVLNSNLAIDLKNEPGASAHLNMSDWRILLDAAWSWKRLTLGLRYQQALSSYTRGGEGGSKARNTALSLYVSYDIWRRRLKK
jgi:hypothetical protein